RSWSIGRTENSQAADGDPLAPRWFPNLLALEVPTARRPAKDTGGHSPAHSPRPLWGAPRIHGELLKLGIDVGQTTVAKYMVRRRQPPSQGWKTFLRNHADGIASMDLFVVPTISFRLLYGFLILQQFSARASVAGRDRTSERPLDCPSADRSVRLATGAAIYRSRSGLRLWRCRHPAASSNGYTGSTDFAAVAMAKRVRGETYRFDPTGLS